MQKVTGLVNKENPTDEKTDFAAFWKAWKLVEEKLPNASETTNQERVYGAIKGMLASFGDPYTTFFSPEENKQFLDEIAGEFGGVGIEMAQKEGVLTVIAPLKDSPAYKAGMQSGDKIVKIDDKLSADMTTDEAISFIRGTPGTTVVLTVVRDGLSEPKAISIVRDIIKIPTVDTERFEAEGVFVIKLYNFSAQSADLFRQALLTFNESGYDKLVLDLRNNPGGYLEASVQMASWFLPKGTVVVKEIGKDEKDTVLHKSYGPGILKDKVKMVVLVNGGSASASEILAGALSDHGIATLAGEQTFGKGSVQEVVTVTPDTSLKVTVAKWYTPNNISISDQGLTPKVEIPASTSPENDTQLKAAVKLLQ
jgi:carboxyl-terminal processing protease